MSASIALGIYCAGLVLTFGWRTFTQYATTGSTGWAGIQKDAPRAARIGAALFVLAILTGLGGLLMATGSVGPALRLPETVGWIGVVVEAAALIFVFAAQESMGASWRIGVDPTERTTLVESGMFARARNPIFTAMVAAQAGVLLAAPNPVSLVAVVSLIAAVQIQVRAVEEPYLLRVHGRRYRDYATRVGRFVPRMGLLSAHPTVGQGDR